MIFHVPRCWTCIYSLEVDFSRLERSISIFANRLFSIGTLGMSPILQGNQWTLKVILGIPYILDNRLLIKSALQICWSKSLTAQRKSYFRKASWSKNLLSQWLNFQLFGITYLVGKIKFKLFFSGSIGWVRKYTIPFHRSGTKFATGRCTGRHFFGAVWTSKMQIRELPVIIKCHPFWGASSFWCYTRWWFQIFFIFTPTWGRFPIWLIFFRWVETTNQIKFLML